MQFWNRHKHALPHHTSSSSPEYLWQSLTINMTITSVLVSKRGHCRSAPSYFSASMEILEALGAGTENTTTRTEASCARRPCHLMIPVMMKGKAPQQGWLPGMAHKHSRQDKTRKYVCHSHFQYLREQSRRIDSTNGAWWWTVLVVVSVLSNMRTLESMHAIREK